VTPVARLTEPKLGEAERRLVDQTGVELDKHGFSKLVMARDFWC
jgi:hypothetical protein